MSDSEGKFVEKNISLLKTTYKFVALTNDKIHSNSHDKNHHPRDQAYQGIRVSSKSYF
jgi:16S rRNA C1402 N4-methylase RsmH